MKMSFYILKFMQVKIIYGAQAHNRGVEGKSVAQIRVAGNKCCGLYYAHQLTCRNI